MGLLSHITPLQSVGHGKNIQLASGSQPSYSPGELWGGGDPDEACVMCTVKDLFNEDGGLSTQSDQSVDPAIGDYTTTNHLFSINAAGGTLSTSLTYDSEAASNEQDLGGDAGYFGWGWQSEISSTYSVNPYGAVTMDQYNSAQVTFIPALSDGCPTGDYGDFQKDTIAGSTLFFCSTSRLDAQLGDFGDFGLEFDEGNGDDTVYSWTSQLAWAGTRADLAAVTYDYDISPAAPNCANDGEVECFSVTENVTGGRYISAQIDSFGLVQEVDDSYGEGWKMGYDSDGDLASVSLPDAGETQYQYNTNQASPYSHELAFLTNLNGGTSTIYYYPTGMVQAIAAPVGGTTQYSYSISSCAIPPGCVASTDNQQATITYPDGESDVDRYTGAIPTGISYGPTNTFGGTGDSTWTIATSYLNDPADEVQYTVTMPDGKNVGYATDAVGNVISYTDALGNITRSMYNDTGGNDLDELCWTAGPTVSIPSNASCSNPPSGSTSYTYDANGNVLSETDPRGYTNYDGYYTNGLLCWKAQASIGNGSACSNAGTSPNGAPTGSTAYEYTLGNVTKEISDYNTISASTTQTAYNPDSEATSITSPNGNVTTYKYGGYDKLNSKNSPTGTTSYTYNGALQVVTVQSPATIVNGNPTYDWTVNTYDADGRLCWTQALQQPGTPGGTCVTSGFPSGSTGYDYSADDDAPTQVTDPNGNVISYTYADLRFPTEPTKTAEPNATTYAEYNSLGQECDGGPVATPTTCPTASSGPVSGDSGSYINDEGQTLQTWDPSGEETIYSYGNADFTSDPTSVENPSLQTTNYSYDADGNEIKRAAPGGNTVEYGYNGMDEECYSAPISTNPEPSCTSVPTESGLTTYVWNNDDERSSMTDDVNGTENTTNYTYDADGNLTDAAGTATDGRNVSYAYNAVDEADCVSYPISASQNCLNPPSSSNTVVDRNYDADGQLTSTTDWLGNTINYNNYNANGQVQQIQFPTTSAETLNYTYDNDGNLRSANYSGSFSAANTWTYNGDEQEASTTQPGFSSPTDSYNGYKQVSGASNPTSTGGSVSDAYSVAANGEMQKDTPAGGSAINYSYSNGTELASVTNPNLNASVADTSIAYTAAGQRCWQSSASSVVGSPTCGSAPTGATSYQWNAYGQLCWSGQTTSTASCASPPSGTLGYTYNGDGLRMTETLPGFINFDFSYDLVDGSVPLDIDDGDNAYIYGDTLFGGAAPVEQINIGSGAVSYLSSIPSGVQDVISSAGSVVEQSAYTTYGTREGTGTAGSTPFGFQGAYTDPTGLMYMISRYYDPTTDQFMSIDPDVAETGEPYAFTGGDPLNETDPSGLYRAGTGGQLCGGGAHPECNDGYGDSGGQGAVSPTGSGDNGSGGYGSGSSTSSGSTSSGGGDPVKPTDNPGPPSHVAPPWWRDIVDIPQDGAYLEYWGSYEAIGHLNSLTRDCGPVGELCSVTTHIVTSPLVVPEAVGLGEDALGNLAKGETVWQEGVPDQPLLGNEVTPRLSLFDHTLVPSFNGPVVSNELGLPGVRFPGLEQDGSVDFAW
jgi:RHS repeat-associated protein